MDMLDFALDGMADSSRASCAQEWGASWDGEAECGGENVLSKLLATSRETAMLTSVRRLVGPLPQSLFQPERMSGYCAT